jgi:light-harvesting complex II chlorophyll a/b binding protein 6
VPTRPLTTTAASQQQTLSANLTRHQAMALASTSAAAVLKTPFLGARHALANAASVAAKPARRALVVAAAAAKKSWIPAFKSDAEFINPPWLDGS